MFIDPRNVVVRTKAEILADVNCDLPPNVDWAAGARRYVRHYFDKIGEDVVEHYALTKPLVQMPVDEHFDRNMKENTAYLYNFVNILQILWLRGGSRIMDVACGGGWLAHFLTRMGYKAFGFDISEEFISLARRRIREDRRAFVPDHLIDEMFIVHDIETYELPAVHRGAYDAIILESCLHHFVDPITALSHLVSCLKPDGLIVVVECENRDANFRPEHSRVMKETETLERAYPRRLLEEIYEASGLPHYEFFGSVNGWFAPRDPRSRTLVSMLDEQARLMNLSICAASRTAMDKCFPWRENVGAAVIIPLSGMSESDGGWYWSTPCSQFKVGQDLSSLTLDILSEVPRVSKRSQTVFVHGHSGLAATATLTAEAHFQRIELNDLGVGEVLTFASGDFFIPEQHHMGVDTRKLSFAVKVDVWTIK